MDKIKIPFNIPACTGKEKKYIAGVLDNRKYSGDGPFTKKCEFWFEQVLGTPRAMLTPSCTHALEMAALLADVREGDEVIMPSYTFTSTANAFVLRGARIVFVDIRPDTMNIDEKLVEAAVTEKTKAIVAVHYAGVSCEMDAIMEIARRHNLIVIEDAAQAIMSRYKGRYCGTIGHFGCFSFHETKNIQCGEGGALLINDARFIERAEIIREKGTDRLKFWRGEVDKYTWRDIGSSYLPSELTAAFLLAQLEDIDIITSDRVGSWREYYNYLDSLTGVLSLPEVPEECCHNGHMFAIRLKDHGERDRLMAHLRDKGVYAVFHYIPLDQSEYGQRVGKISGTMVNTRKESERLLRLPLYYKMEKGEIGYVSTYIYNYLHK